MAMDERQCNEKNSNNYLKNYLSFCFRTVQDRIEGFENTIDTVSNLVFWSRLANKLGPWHNVYIIRQ